jgi:hypothetical protein
MGDRGDRGEILYIVAICTPRHMQVLQTLKLHTANKNEDRVESLPVTDSTIHPTTIEEVFMKYLIGLLASIFILSGCATTGEKDVLACEGKDWGAFGKSAAESGIELRTIDKYKSGCSNFDESSLDAYLDGYARGLITFCSYDQGYAHGKNSVPASEICPLEIRQLYVGGYNIGQREYKENILKIDRLRRASEDTSDQQHMNPAKGGSSAESPSGAYDGAF